MTRHEAAGRPDDDRAGMSLAGRLLGPLVGFVHEPYSDDPGSLARLSTCRAVTLQSGHLAYFETCHLSEISIRI